MARESRPVIARMLQNTIAFSPIITRVFGQFSRKRRNWHGLCEPLCHEQTTHSHTVSSRPNGCRSRAEARRNDQNARQCAAGCDSGTGRRLDIQNGRQTPIKHTALSDRGTGGRLEGLKWGQARPRHHAGAFLCLIRAPGHSVHPGLDGQVPRASVPAAWSSDHSLPTARCVRASAR